MPCLLAYLAGLVAVVGSPELMPGPSVALLTGVACILVRNARMRLPLAFLTGVIWATIGTSHLLTDRLPESLTGRVFPVQGVVAGLVDEREGVKRFQFQPEPDINGLPKRLRLTWYNAPDSLAPGQGYRLFVKLKPPHGVANPGGFDYERWLAVNRIGATGYVRAKPKPVRRPDLDRYFALDIWRDRFSRSVQNSLDGKSNAGLIKALLLADRRGISAEQWRLLRATGTAHLAAISGLHLGLVAALVFALSRRLLARCAPMRLSPPRLAALLALMAAGVYAGLAGFGVATLRAWLMVAAVLLAVVAGRHVRPFRILSLAFLIMVSISPLALTEPGLWLSFAAVAYLFLMFKNRLTQPVFWRSALISHLALALALAPLTLSFFQQASIIAPLANIWAVPVFMMAIVPSILVAGLVSFWPVLAAPLFALADLLLTWVFSGLTIMAGHVQASIHLLQPPFWALLLALIGVVWLLGPALLPRRWPALALFLPLFYPAVEVPAFGEFKLTVLDVGQGSAAVLQTQHHVLLFDTGPKFRTGTDMGAMVVTPFLRQQGIGKIDKLMVSHPDIDHAGGMDSLLAEWSVTELYHSDSKTVAGRLCKAGQRWQWDGVDFKVLAPGDGADDWNDNNRSCVLKVTSVWGRALLTGDIEAKAERALLTLSAEDLPAEVLLAPHHGSRGSSTSPFLAAVKPDWILISAGYRNRFGFPHQQTLARFQSVGSHWLNTADSGAISVDFSHSGIGVNRYRADSKRIWRHF